MNLKLLYFLLVPALFTLASCREDDDPIPGIPPELNSPNIESISSMPHPPGSQIGFVLSGDTGSVALMTLEVKEEGNTIDEFRIRINSTEILENPLVISEQDKNGYEWFVTLRIHEGESTREYEILLKDENGQQDRINFMIESRIREIVSLYPGRLEHSDTMAGLGAMDIDNGRSLARGDAAAELINKGNDGGMWKSIQAVNGAILRSVQVDFGSIEYSDQIESAYQNGSLADSPEVEVGQEYVVRKGDNYYLLSVTSFFQDSGSDLVRINFQIKK